MKPRPVPSVWVILGAGALVLVLVGVLLAAGLPSMAASGAPAITAGQTAAILGGELVLNGAVTFSMFLPNVVRGP